MRVRVWVRVRVRVRIKCRREHLRRCAVEVGALLQPLQRAWLGFRLGLGLGLS